MIVSVFCCALKPMRLGGQTLWTASLFAVPRNHKENNPQRYPHCIAAAFCFSLFLASRALRSMLTFRSIADGLPDERDRHSQIGLVPKPLPGVAPSADKIVVPAAVAALRT